MRIKPDELLLVETMAEKVAAWKGEASPAIFGINLSVFEMFFRLIERPGTSV